MIETRPARFLNTGEIDIKDIDPEVLPAVEALRAKGVETLASCSGVCSRPGHDGYGSFIQVYPRERVHVDGLEELADSITSQLQQIFNVHVELQFVSAAAWYKDPNTRSRQILVGQPPVYRLQLAGSLEQKDYSHALRIVREGI